MSSEDACGLGVSVRRAPTMLGAFVRLFAERGEQPRNRLLERVLGPAGVS